MTQNPGTQHFDVSAPVPLALMGEYDSSLDRRVLALATNLRYRLEVRQTSGDVCTVHFPGERPIEFGAHGPLEDLSGHPIVQQVFGSTLAERGALSKAYTFTVEDTGIERSGLNIRSSEAVVWLTALQTISAGRPPQDHFRTAHKAHEYLGESSGEDPPLWSLISAATGGLLQFDLLDEEKPIALETRLDGLVLGFPDGKVNLADALHHASRALQSATEFLSKGEKGTALRDIPTETVFRMLKDLTDLQAQSLYASVVNRDLHAEARKLFEQESVDKYDLGRLLDERHIMCRDYLGMESEEQEGLVSAAKKAGALGCCLHGLKGGVIAYAPDRQKSVTRAIDKAGGAAIIIRQDTGIFLGLS